MDDFQKLVKQMRTKQREYFRTRTSEVLRECKDLERRVDEAVAKALVKEASRNLFEQTKDGDE
ncbi:MAG: hypothetical protein U0791_23335 [Gemmataceae bacterium]